MEKLETLDNSMMADFRKCPRYFQFRHIESLVPVSDYIKFKAEFGSALHDALESWYTERNAIKMDTAFIDYWSPFEGQDDKGIRTVAKGLLICEKYRSWYPTEPFEILETEVGGAVDLGPFLFTFKCDGLIKDHKGDHWILEHKTSAHRGFLIPNPNVQLTGYIQAVSILKGVKVKGAYLNQIYFRKGRKGEPQMDTIELKREETTRTDMDLAEWFEDAKSWARAIGQACEEEYFPKCTESCTAYGGCQYIEICKCGDLDVQETVKTALFKKEKWEPYPGAKEEVESC